MGLTVKRENDFGSLFDKFASLPDDVKKMWLPLIKRIKNPRLLKTTRQKDNQNII